MASFVESKIDDLVQVITTEGRVFTGFLKSFDQSLNLVLNNCIENIYSEVGVEFVKLNVYLIRGDNVALICDVDKTNEDKIDIQNIKAHPLKNIRTQI